MDKKLNICIISREFVPDTAFGGIATFSLDTALLLRSHGHNVTVLSQGITATGIYKENGIEIHKIYIPFGNYKNLPLFIVFFNILVFLRLYKLNKIKKFDIIDAPDHLAEGLFAALFTNIPTVARLHTPYSLIVHLKLNNYRKSVSYWFIKICEKIFLKKAAVLYSPSKNLASLSFDFFKIQKKIHFFGYPIDLQIFSPAKNADKNSSSPTENIKILFLGRLEQRKGIETIAQAFPRVVKSNTKVTLTIIGKDTSAMPGFSSSKEYLIKAFNDGQCLSKVQFLDQVPLNSLPEQFNKHDIVWVPSLYDNYPLVCIEAMACGKAVISSDAGGLPEIINSGENGILFETQNSEQLAQATLDLCESPDKINEIGKKARAYIATHFNSDFIYKETMELYKNALTFH